MRVSLIMRWLWRAIGASGLLLVAISMPMIGFGAAEHYENEKFLGILEADWFFVFGFLAAGSCIWASWRLIRPIRPR